MTDYNDKAAGIAKGHYFHQDLLVSQMIFNDNPKNHIDIGSRIDGFIAHVASYREIEVADIRKLDSNIKNVKFSHYDFMKDTNLIAKISVCVVSTCN